MFSYLYYWFYSHHYKKKYKFDDNPVFPASCAVGVIQGLIIYNIIMIIRLFIPRNHSFGKLTTLLLTLLLAIACICFNSMYYGRRLSLLSEKYESYSINRWLKSWMMWLFMFGLFLLPILSSFIFHLFN